MRFSYRGPVEPSASRFYRVLLASSKRKETKRRAQELARRLEHNPELWERFESLLDLSQSDELKTIDDIEGVLIDEVRKLGSDTLESWASRNIEVGLSAPYVISYRSIIPTRGEAENLLVPVAVSSSHIAFGSMRMEPVFMILGQSAATAAVHAIDDGVAVQAVDYPKLRQRLLADDQVLENPATTRGMPR